MLLRYLSALMLMFSPFSGVQKHAVPHAQTELHGVDVSHYQFDIDWGMVAEMNPVDFAFVKATEGHDYIDTFFCQNWEDLKQFGIRRGAYHFFRAYGCGEEQAANFLSLVDMHPGDLAPVLDIERIDGVEPEIMLEEARIWLNRIEETLHIKPIIYTNQYFYDRYLAGQFNDYPLWIAKYSEDKPFLSDGETWDFWQYSCKGCVDGISQKVDLNIFPGTKEMLETLCWYPETTQESVTARP
ncbi:MAG: GH25 family lysozyme [Saprospiraceae bacterium]|nr:glycoside hydrolase family 25 protein [Saprospiraceae bacterium]MCB9345129.1 glycoside hydrolase family 25 protein [Lewinellaceae bacterium]